MSAQTNLVIGVVGAGVMGRGIVQLFAQAGHIVRMFDAREGAATEAKASVVSMLERLAAKGNFSEAALHSSIENMKICTALQDVADCGMIVEAIVEDLGAKQSLFRDLESIATPDCILASNTSSLTVSAIAAGCEKPGRVIGLHFFNPVPLMKIAEIIPGIRTEPEITETVRVLVQAAGHKTVTAADQPGFLINHAGRGLYGEGFRIVEENVASFADVDRIMRDSCGFRMGPFELMDLTGLDVSGKVMQSIFDQFQQDPRYRPSSLVPPRLAAGIFGRKTGEGFYKYNGTQKSEPNEPAVHGSAANGPIWVAAGKRYDELASRLAAAGAQMAENPGDATTFVLMPWGEDITTAAQRLGLDPALCVGIDPILHWDRRLVLMTSPVTRPENRDAVRALLGSNETKVTVIADSPGFVSQRIIAMIVNIACEIAQRGISRPAEIDPAIRLGLGYPSGPLELGDKIGAAEILTILERIQAITGDPRYRPSLWLRRRAMLGVSLLHEPC
jgi:3-hydroxybutyryl-CoA dehydrogenase